MIDSNLTNRIQRHASQWHVVVEETFETASSVIAFGTRAEQPVVLKVIKRSGDEWRSGEILKAFAGNGTVHVYEHTPGAVLLERLRPGNSLVELTLNGHDDEATDILANVIQQMSARATSMSPSELPPACATVEDWAKGFERYLQTRDEKLPRDLVEEGQRVYLELSKTQRRSRLLHGDLQHYNVLFDSERGWLAIDPKGVIGEVEYEIGAALRNPFARPDLFLSRSIIERRLKQFIAKLNLDFERVLAWSFAQAVLSAIWEIEDGFVVDPTNPSLRLSEAIRPMIEAENGGYRKSTKRKA